MSSATAPLEERCEAMLKTIHRWRCTRRGHSHADQPPKLCAQHRYFGAKVPERWEHPRLDNGVISCEPHPPIWRWIGTRLSLTPISTRWHALR